MHQQHLYWRSGSQWNTPNNCSGINSPKMTNFQNTFRVFLWKVKKQKTFNWFKNALFTLLPIILVIINFIVLYEDETARRHDERSEPFTEVSENLDILCCWAVLALDEGIKYRISTLVSHNLQHQLAVKGNCFHLIWRYDNHIPHERYDNDVVVVMAYFIVSSISPGDHQFAKLVK